MLDCFRHQEVGRRPRQPACPGKVDRVSGCGSPAEQLSGRSVGPPQTEGFLFSSTRIAPDTVRAYLETEYHVFGEPAFTLQVGEPSPALLAAHRRWRVQCSALLTACNPLSGMVDEAANVLRQDALGRELSRLGFACLEGVGRHPSNGWPAEPSFLVMGLNLDTARNFGTRFDQNAVVWNAADAVPQLILLR